MNFYDKNGDPIPFKKWGLLQQHPEYTRVALTRVSPDVTVSTIWVGIDFGFAPEGMPPLIFETMVFDASAGYPATLCERYATEESALAGHAMAEAIARANVRSLEN